MAKRMAKNGSTLPARKPIGEENRHTGGETDEGPGDVCGVPGRGRTYERGTTVIKIPTAPLQRIAFGVAFSSLVAMGAGAIALVTQPAASSAGSTTQQVEYVDPVADEEPTTSTTVAPVNADVVERAEAAASRAEGAAGRAEVAAVKVETIASSTTTTTLPAPTTSTTGPSGPTMIGTIIPVTETTTTSTTVPKLWVVVARFPITQVGYDRTAPLTADVELQTGQLRISGIPYVAPWRMYGTGGIWLGATPAPSECSIIASAVPGGELHEGDDCWPTGLQTLSAGSNIDGQWTSPYSGQTNNSAEIIVEEYR